MTRAIRPPVANAVVDPLLPALHPPAGVLTRFRDGLERNAFAVLVLGAFCGLHARFVRDDLIADAWSAVLDGRIVSRFGLPHHDTLTVLTLGHAWVDQQWLGQLGLYALWAAGGWRLALLSVVALYLCAFVVPAIAARRLGASDRSVALVVGACFLTGLPNTVLRTQIPAYVLFSLVLALLLRDERRPSRRVLLVFPLLVLWANVHGSVVLGAALVSLRGATLAAGALRARRPPRAFAPRAGALLALPWLCTLASPYGLALPGYYRSILGNSALEHAVTEWGPSTVRGQPVFFALLFAGLWLAFRSPGAVGSFATLALLGTGLLGLLAVRNDVWFALAGAAVLPRALDARWPPPAAPRRRSINLALATAGALAALGAAAGTAAQSGAWFLHSYPPRAAAAVASAARADPRLRVFADERYADWLLFEDPQLAGRVAYDIRYELLSARQLAALLAFRTEHGLDWQAAADGYGLLVLDPAGDRGAVELYERRPGTRVLYSDRDVVVLRLAGAAGTA